MDAMRMDERWATERKKGEGWRLVAFCCLQRVVKWLQREGEAPLPSPPGWAITMGGV